MNQISFDLKHLTSFDTTHITNIDSEEQLLQSANLIFQQFFEQIKEQHTSLPKPVIILPREKHIPVEAPKTRFEQFKKEKGLKFQKKERLVYDKITGEWKPRYGYGKAISPDDDFIIEVPNNNFNLGSTEDPFAKREAEKKNRIKEQLKRERRNQKRAARAESQIAAASLSTKSKKTLHLIDKAKDLATNPGSSASMNQFNKNDKKPPIYENGSKIPKTFDRNKGQIKKK